MKRALISTLYNEAGSVTRWLEALQAQTMPPDEFVVVDGGSTDGTVALLEQGIRASQFPRPRVIVQRTNIAAGRNLAIRNTTAEIITCIDAGSLPERTWFEQLTRPLMEHPEVDVAGGHCPFVARNAFQKRIERYAQSPELSPGGDCHPSSRNVAFRRPVWESVGGYPEWLTLTAEDALFNANLHAVGARFFYQPAAVVNWEARPDLASYLKMMRSYGYGSGEMGQTTALYWRWLLTTIVPPLVLFSRHPLADAGLRYRRNAASALGWLAAKFHGHRPPKDWRRVEGVWLSPEAVQTLNRRRATRPE